MSVSPSLVHIVPRDPACIRIAATSDLHFDPDNKVLTPPTLIAAAADAFLAQQQNQPPDLVILAGDLGHGRRNFQECVEIFTKRCKNVAVIAGNHDVWRDPEEEHTSWHMWEHELPRICRDVGAIWLEQQDIQLGALRVVGSMAWYDYSGIPDTFVKYKRDPDLVRQLKRMLNNDANWIDWSYSDLDFAAILRRQLIERIQKAQDDPAVKAIAVATHVPILWEQMETKNDDEAWSLSNAYFGHMTLGEAVRNVEKLRLVLSGHTHIGKHGVIQRQEMKPLQYHVVPSDYQEPKISLLDVNLENINSAGDEYHAQKDEGDEYGPQEIQMVAKF